jgi:hypothetical protein
VEDGLDEGRRLHDCTVTHDDTLHDVPLQDIALHDSKMGVARVLDDEHDEGQRRHSQHDASHVEESGAEDEGGESKMHLERVVTAMKGREL